jgi:hypothetical protein
VRAVLCTRCSHPLNPRADRCLRCFALNPQNRGMEPLAPASPPREAAVAAGGPQWFAPKQPEHVDPARLDAGRLEFRGDSDPPASYRATLERDSAPLAAGSRPRSSRAEHGGARAGRPQLPLAFAPGSDPSPGERPRDAQEAETEPPEIFDATLEPALLQAAAAPPAADRARPAARAAPAFPVPGRRARIGAWTFDAAALGAVFALHVAVAALLVGPRRISPGGPQSLDTWADLLLFARALPLLWSLLAACLALAYSWTFVALVGRTPGMLLAGLHVVRLRRGTPQRVTVARALVRAALALPSLACGAFGFVLALFDARGQALHDRLSGCRVVADSGPGTR